ADGPVKCAEEAVGLALAASPDIRGAEQTIAKARAPTGAANRWALSRATRPTGRPKGNSAASSADNSRPRGRDFDIVRHEPTGEHWVTCGIRPRKLFAWRPRVPLMKKAWRR